MLAPLIENACRYGRSRVEVSVFASAQRVEIIVDDDGPGMVEDEREQVFEAGVRGSAAESAGGDGGAGLGSRSSRRLARAGGGEVEAVVGVAGGGARLILGLPAPPR